MGERPDRAKPGKRSSGAFGARTGGATAERASSGSANDPFDPQSGPAPTLTLIGFRHSVYTRIVRMGLIEMALEADYIEADSFAETPDPVLVEHSPFGRVPVLRHGDFTLTETAAILRYLDATGTELSLVPDPPKVAARLAQVVGILDAYGYWPMVRDVFSHGVYRALVGDEPDPRRVARGLKAAAPVLQTLDRIAEEALILQGTRITLADVHLAPMMACFTAVPEGEAALRHYPALSHWWLMIHDRPSLTATDPLPGLRLGDTQAQT